MKITKRQLKRIIKEEKAKLLKEGMDSKPVNPRLVSNMDDAFYDFKRNLEGADKRRSVDRLVDTLMGRKADLRFDYIQNNAISILDDIDV